VAALSDDFLEIKLRANLFLEYSFSTASLSSGHQSLERQTFSTE